MSNSIETENSKQKMLEMIQNTSAGANEKLMLQVEFFADAIANSMTCPPQIWNGKGLVKGKSESNHLRLCWNNPVNEKWIELILSDSSAGVLVVDGNLTNLKWIATEESAAEAFKSAFRYVYGEK